MTSVSKLTLYEIRMKLMSLDKGRVSALSTKGHSPEGPSRPHPVYNTLRPPFQESWDSHSDEGFTHQLQVHAPSNPSIDCDSPIAPQNSVTKQQSDYQRQPRRSLTPLSRLDHTVSSGLTQREAFLFRLWVQRLSLSVRTFRKTQKRI